MEVETIKETNPELAEYNLDDYDEEKPVGQGVYYADQLGPTRLVLLEGVFKCLTCCIVTLLDHRGNNL